MLKTVILLTTPMLLVGIATVRPAVRVKGPRPPATPIAPPPLENTPVVLAEKPCPVDTTGLSGMDVVGSPNVFTGMSPNGEVAAMPLPLGREEELEYVRRALFFVASNDAQRALAEAARSSSSSSSEEDVDATALFNHEEILLQMRKASCQAEAHRQAQARRGKLTATEVPCEVPEELSDTEFRLTVSLGRAAYNKLFHHNRKLIYFEVNKVIKEEWRRATVMEKADFLQEGAQGLLRAIRLFDTARGVRFSTYASWHVRAFVLRALRDKSHIVRLPQTLQADMGQIRKARYRYAVENQGHNPSDAALAEMLSMPPQRIREALKGLASASAASLDSAGPVHPGAQAGSFGQEPLGSRVASKKHDSVAAENDLYATQLQHKLQDAMKERDPKRVRITRLKYGMEDGVEWTYPQIAKSFNITTNIAKGIVRSEVNFLRRTKKRELQDFVGHAT